MFKHLQRLFFTGFITLYLSTIPLFSQHLVGYWQNWNGTEALDLNNIDTRYTVINLSFAVPGVGTDYNMTFDPCCGETVSSFKAKIATLKTAGKIVNLSIGGGGTSIVLDNTTERDVFISSMTNLINTFEVDGIDIDLESSSLSVTAGTTIANPTDANIVNMIYAIDAIKNSFFTTYGTKMFLGFTPETAFAQGGQSSYGGIWGAYLPVLHALRADIDLIYPQLYNSGSMYGLDGAIYSSATADFIVSQTEKMIAGFNVPGSTNSAGTFIGFPASKIAVGLPACPSAAGSGWTSPAVVKQAIDYLRGSGPKPGSYTLQAGPYPDLGGMMTWSINWDATPTCNAAYEYAANYELIFQTGTCEQPDLGNDMTVCEVTFPHTLQSNTTTNGSATFTWINATTSQTLVSNSTSANSLAISTAGTYRVIRTENGCSRSDQVAIHGTLAVPVLAGPLNLCSGAPITISLQNSSSFPLSTSFQWYKNNQALSGETTSSLTGTLADGVYALEAEYGTCLESSTHTVASNLPTAVNDCVGPGESAALSITNTTNGVTYQWFTEATGGTQVATGTSYNTSPLAATTNYYIQAQGQTGSSVTGPPLTNNGLGTFNNWTSPSELYFNALEAFTIKEITFHPMVYAYTHPFNMEFRNSSNVVLSNGSQAFSITHPGPYGSPVGPLTLTFSNGGVDIPAGTGFKLVFTSAVGNAHWGGTSFPVGYSPYFNLTGSNVAGSCVAVHNWLIEVDGCAYRVPVVATVDPICAALPVSFLELSAKANDAQVELNWKIETADPEGTFFIQRKIDGEADFQTIGQTDLSLGMPTPYTFVDKDVVPNTDYNYRLKYVETDGDISFSPIRTARLILDKKIQIYPNPTDAISYLYQTDNELITIEILEVTGKLIRRWPTDDSKVAINLTDQPEGIYLIKVTSTNQAAQQFKLVKNHAH